MGIFVNNKSSNKVTGDT